MPLKKNHTYHKEFKFNRIFKSSPLPGLMRLCCVFACMLLSLASFDGMAESVSQKQAQKMAQQFFNQAYKEAVAPVKLVYNGKRLTTGRLFTPFYVYNQPRGGFVIISAENKTFPILAYSLDQNFDPDGLTESEKSWLSSYAHDIEMIRYDSRVPDEATQAWNNYPEYLVDLLNAPYMFTDPKNSTEEYLGALEEILSVDDSDSSLDGEYSAYYTPAQWQDMIDSELFKNGEVAIGYVDMHRRLTPGVLHGKKGDYYRILFDRNNDWLVRLLPAEYLGERMIAVIGTPRYVAPEEEQENAFEFYDSYKDLHSAESNPSTNSIYEARMALIDDKPIVKGVGGGHFDVILPEEAVLAMLYNIQGSHIGRASYGGSSTTAHINIEGQPHGIYPVVIIGKSGKAYSVKLYR